MNVFLAFAFRDKDKELAGIVDRLLACQSVQLTTGERLGGNALTPAVQQRIENCDALIALLTRRDQMVNGGWTTHTWVEDELQHARAVGKPAIALIEDRVTTGGMYQQHEHIPLDRNAPTEALLCLAETIADWKKDRGRSIKVRLTPDDLGRRLGSKGKPCRYRFMLEGNTTAWKDATPFTEPGGASYLWAHGIHENQMIEVQAEEGGMHWKSNMTPQDMLVEFMEGGAAI